MSRSQLANIIAIGKLLLSALIFFSCVMEAQTGADITSPHIELGIIVTSTEAEAQSVLGRLNAGWDFGVLAKEKSIDVTAIDGGYFGRFTVSQLQPEIETAVAGLKVGQLSSIIHTSAGFTILKVLPVAPPTEDLTTEHLAAMVASDTIHLGVSLAGLGEADALLFKLPKPNGWDRDLKTSCSVRNQSYDLGLERLRAILDGAKAGSSDTYSAADIIRTRIYVGQLYAYAGKMDEAINELKLAYQMAQITAPKVVPQLEEYIGVAYLHYSEMENGVYRNSSDLDIFPPVNHNASYEKQEKSKTAIQYFTKYLERNPNDLEVKWLLNLSYMTIGEYPVGVPAAYLIPEAGFQSKEDIGRFVDVADAAGLNVVREAGGAIADDFENNGQLDIVVSSMDVCAPLKYFHNNGDGTFTDRTVEAGLADQLGALNIVQSDFNNDGCMDILILRGGWEYPQRKSLMRNNCNGTFTDVTDASGLGASVTATNSAVWVDIDNDGYLDLFVGNENSPSQLFRNNGDGTFEDISHSAGIDQTAFTKGVTAADYDQDGFVDFYVSNTNGANYLYHNNGNLTFTEVGRQAGVQAPLMSFATWFFDYDNDGWPDLFVTSYLMSVSESVKSYIGVTPKAETLKLYRNKHDGTFEDVTEKVGLDKVLMPMGANFGDVDNDGFLDIYLGMGTPSYAALMPHTLLLNKGGKSFVDITASSGTGELHKGHAIVFADLDRSGNEAIIAETGGAVPGDSHLLRVFKNPGNKNDWINIHLVGVKSNRSGVGTRIKITVADDGQAPRTIYRTEGETSSFGANPLELHIGLGHNAHILAIDLWWPASKTNQHFENIDKNQFIEIKEFAKEVGKLTRPAFNLGVRTTKAANLNVSLPQTAADSTMPAATLDKKKKATESMKEQAISPMMASGR